MWVFCPSTRETSSCLESATCRLGRTCRSRGNIVKHGHERTTQGSWANRVAEPGCYAMISPRANWSDQLVCRNHRGQHNVYAMNRFRVAKGSEAAFEQVWISWDSHLDKVAGLRAAPKRRTKRLYASHRAVFDAWTKSEAFRGSAGARCMTVDARQGAIRLTLLSPLLPSSWNVRRVSKCVWHLVERLLTIGPSICFSSNPAPLFEEEGRSKLATCGFDFVDPLLPHGPRSRPALAPNNRPMDPGQVSIGDRS